MADIAEQNLDPLKSQTTLKGVALSLLYCIYSTYKIQNPLSKETIYIVVIFFCVHVSLFKITPSLNTCTLYIVCLFAWVQIRGEVPNSHGMKKLGMLA